MIKERKVIIRVFDNILSAETAKRVLQNAGIKSTILNYSKINFSALINQAYEINLARIKKIVGTDLTVFVSAEK